MAELIGPTLTYAGLALLVARLETIKTTECAQVVTIDFGEIAEIETPWTPVLALLLKLGHQGGFVCRIRNLRGQPANVFVLYRKSEELMRLLRAGMSSRHDAPVMRKAG